MKELIAAIKKKKELQSLDDAFVQQKIQRIFNANNLLKQKFLQSKDFRQFSKSKEYEELLKRIRKELRVIYGVFQKEDRKTLLEELNKAKDKLSVVEKILASHQSTKERLPYYDEILKRIAADCDPKTVIDLGCGMNPLALGLAQHITASDISSEDLEFLEKVSRILRRNVSIVKLDLTKDEDIRKLSKLKGDVTLLFKLLDTLEEARRHVSYELFKHIKTPWIVASFPTKSLGGKKRIARAGRSWFERLLARNKLTWTTFSVENELFYVIKTE